MEKIISGYTDCACRDCFDLAISCDIRVQALCLPCQDAGCESNGTGRHGECQRDDAYGCDEF